MGGNCCCSGVAVVSEQVEVVLTVPMCVLRLGCVPAPTLNWHGGFSVQRATCATEAWTGRTRASPAPPHSLTLPTGRRERTRAVCRGWSTARVCSTPGVEARGIHRATITGSRGDDNHAHALAPSRCDPPREMADMPRFTRTGMGGCRGPLPRTFCEHVDHSRRLQELPERLLLRVGRLRDTHDDAAVRYATNTCSGHAHGRATRLRGELGCAQTRGVRTIAEN